MTVLSEPLTRLMRRAGAGLLGLLRQHATLARDVREPADEARPDRRAARLRLPRPDAADLHRRAGLPGVPVELVARRTAPSPSRTCTRCRTPSPSSWLPVTSADRWRCSPPRRGLGDRTVLVQVTSLLTLPFAVAGTDMCAFVPSRLARHCLDMLDLVDRHDPPRRRPDHRGRPLAPPPRRRSRRRLAAPAPLRRRGRRRDRRLTVVATSGSPYPRATSSWPSRSPARRPSRRR